MKNLRLADSVRIHAKVVSHRNLLWSGNFESRTRLLVGAVVFFLESSATVAFNSNFYNGNAANTNNKNNTNNNHVRLVRSLVCVDFDRIYLAYQNCMRRKAGSPSALQFSAGDLVENLNQIVEDINNRTYVHSRSSCFGILYPTPREIYAAQFRDRVVQHFYTEEIEDCLNKTLIENTTSCRKGKGTDYALKVLNDFLVTESKNGTRDCFFWKIDLSGYFMSIIRKQLSGLMRTMILDEYIGAYEEDILYLTPIIYENNPAKDRIMRMTVETWNSIPERKRMNPLGEAGLAIGNITAQHGSNMNLNGIDHLIVDGLGNPCFVRYVDDMIIVNSSKEKLLHDFPIIENALNENGQKINHHKTILDTAYHGVKFLGKVSYPYGYQKPSKESAARMMKSAKELKIDENLISKVNSQAGRFRHFASYNLMHDYINALPEEVWEYIKYDEDKKKFIQIKEIQQ